MMVLPRPSALVPVVVTSILMAITVCNGIVILEEDLEGYPEVHKTGSLAALNLDCPFAIEEQDIPEHLAVQWEYMGLSPHIYQWIHDLPPISLGPFKNRVDLEYQVSEDPIYKHRALSLLNPTTELTGIYTCRVSSFNDDKRLTRRVIIYSEPSEFKIESQQIDKTSFKIICAADSVFPEPEVYLYKNYDGELLEIEGVQEEKTWKSTNSNGGEGSYSIEAEVNIADEDLTGPTEFGCDLRIPETNITFTETISYEPRDTIDSSEKDEPESSPQNDLTGDTIDSSEKDEPESSPQNDLTGDSPHEAASTSGSNCRCHLAVLLVFVSSLLLVLNL